jgi:hypothetical protein
MTLSHESVEPPADQPMPATTADTVRSRVMAANALLHVHEREAAIRAFESAVDLALTSPDRGTARGRGACRQASALGQPAGAVEAGFRQPELLAIEPAFAGYRSSSTYISSLELARRNQHPCADDPEHRVFDFFVGRWHVTTPDARWRARTTSRRCSAARP